MIPALKESQKEQGKKNKAPSSSAPKEKEKGPEKAKYKEKKKEKKHGVWGDRQATLAGDAAGIPRDLLLRHQRAVGLPCVFAPVVQPNDEVEASMMRIAEANALLDMKDWALHGIAGGAATAAATASDAAAAAADTS